MDKNWDMMKLLGMACFFTFIPSSPPSFVVLPPLLVSFFCFLIFRFRVTKRVSLYRKLSPSCAWYPCKVCSNHMYNVSSDSLRPPYPPLPSPPSPLPSLSPPPSFSLLPFEHPKRCSLLQPIPPHPHDVLRTRSGGHPRHRRIGEHRKHDECGQGVGSVHF